MSKLVSGRVKKTPQSGITSDRYQFLGLDQAEPDLGDPLIGPSSIGSNPYAGAIDDLYLVSSDGSGNRYWISQPDAISGGIVTPGSITVRDTGVIVGSVNQVTDINFVGTGVTVISPATWVGAGSSSVDIRIAISDVFASGNEGNIQFKSSAATGGLLKGSDQLIYVESTQRVGIGTSIPQHKLDVSGTIRSTGVISGVATFTSINVDQGDLQIQLNGIRTGIGSFTASPGTAYIADSFNISTFDYKVVEYTLHITHSTGIQAQKVLIMQDGTNAYSQEYAIMFQPQILVSIGSTIVAGEARLLITPETGISGVTTYRFTRYSLE